MLLSSIGPSYHMIHGFIGESLASILNLYLAFILPGKVSRYRKLVDPTPRESLIGSKKQIRPRDGFKNAIILNVLNDLRPIRNGLPHPPTWQWICQLFFRPDCRIWVNDSSHGGSVRNFICDFLCNSGIYPHFSGAWLLPP